MTGLVCIFCVEAFHPKFIQNIVEKQSSMRGEQSRARGPEAAEELPKLLGSCLSSIIFSSNFAIYARHLLQHGPSASLASWRRSVPRSHSQRELDLSFGTIMTTAAK
jgi:hypothetical protein